MKNKFIPLTLLLIIFYPSILSAWTQAYTLETRQPIKWWSSCYYWTLTREDIVNTDVNPNAIQPTIPFEEIQNAVRSSFNTWQEVDCSYFYFVETEAGYCHDANFDKNCDNANRIFWREKDWISEDAPWRLSNQMALTSVFYNTETGEIWDVDIEINGQFFEWTTTTEYPVNDIQNTITHEIGHTLGLDHSQFPDATMYGYSEEGDLMKRDLSQDDIEGLCHIYNIEEDPNICKEPIGGLDTDCKCNIESNGCNCTFQFANTKNNGYIIYIGILIIIYYLFNKSQ